MAAERRARVPMPDDVRAALPQTRARRLAQMLDELGRGGLYMGMQHAPSRKEQQ